MPEMRRDPVLVEAPQILAALAGTLIAQRSLLGFNLLVRGSTAAPLPV